MTQRLRLLGVFAAIAALSGCERVVDLFSTIDGGSQLDGVVGPIDTGVPTDARPSPPRDAPIVLDGPFNPADAPFVAPAVPSSSVRTRT